MTMKKQLLLLVMMLLPLVASADAVEIDGIYYNLFTESNVAEVTSNPNKYMGSIVIPASVNYNNVTYSVTSIGESAFSECFGLTSVTIGNNVMRIGEGAFWHCSGLTSITIGNSVTSIDMYAFSGCSGLTSVTIPNSVTSIGIYAFRDCFGLISITIGNSVTRIGNGVFHSCSNLTSVIIPNSVTSIGGKAFELCSSLTSVTIGNSVTSIDEGVFNDCRIESILTRNAKTTFNSKAFSDRTYQHAMLYIPEGTWGEAVYDSYWYKFYNIREVAMKTDDLSSSQAYTLMDTNTFGYAVYDGTSDEVKMVKAFYSINEQDPNNCWLIKTKADKKYLFNLGAKKYAIINADGRITLTENETAIEVREDDNSIMLGADTNHQWGFVKNNSQPDITGVSAQMFSSEQNADSYYSLDGQHKQSPHKGLNIVRMNDGTTKKIVRIVGTVF